MPVGGRVAGKVGIYSNHYNGKSYKFLKSRSDSSGYKVIDE